MPPELSRRSFLKAVAVTGAAATGCGEAPGRQLMPYVIPDENVIPGVPAFYAGACRECTAGCGVVARVREGRVIKLEGNPQDPVSGGALCARGQAALQGLYNPDRLPGPHTRGGDGQLAAVSWDDALAMLGGRLRAAAQAGPDRVAFLGPSQGPTLDDLIGRWLGVWRSKRRVAYEALDDEPERNAAAICFRRTDLPVYRLDAADTILSFGADFLETWRSPVEFTRQYAAFRAPRSVAGTLTMGHAVYVGPRFGLTAANADEWLAPHPGTESLVALGVLALVARSGQVRGPHVDVEALQRFTTAYPADVVETQTGIPERALRAAAKRFGDGAAAVALAGTHDPTTHVAAFLLNVASGAFGTRVRFLEDASPPPPASRDVAALLEAMRAGAVDVVVVTGANPVFTMAPLLGAEEAFKRVPLVVWCGGVPDETAELAHLLLPVHHPLETWSDAAPRAGVRVLGQPVMQPVFDSRRAGRRAARVRARRRGSRRRAAVARHGRGRRGELARVPRRRFAAGAVRDLLGRRAPRGRRVRGRAGGVRRPRPRRCSARRSSSPSRRASPSRSSPFPISSSTTGAAPTSHGSRRRRSRYHRSSGTRGPSCTPTRRATSA